MKLKLLLLSAAVILLVGSFAVYDAAARLRSAAAMSQAASQFLNALTPEQRVKASFKFEDEQRFDWHFVPRDRQGLPLGEMNEAQRKLAMAFLQSGLSARGFTKATSIMNTLEAILRDLEGPQRRWPRDSGLYYVSVFGTPGTKQAWGWRFEGHHFSQNFTINGSSIVAASPSFFGTNPAEVRAEVPQKGLRVLAAEEDLARALVRSLNDQQKAKAIYDAKAPGDILTMNKPQIGALDKAGLTAADLTKAQFEQLTKLVEEYCNNVPADLAAARREKFQKTKREEIYFAWAGGIEKDDPSYYRVQTPSFLIEYDDTQNNANHIHSVWRDFNGDFGRDLLAEHYRSVLHGRSIERGSRTAFTR